MGHIGDIGRGPRGHGAGHGPKGPGTSSAGGLTPADSAPTSTTSSTFEGTGAPRTRPGPPEGTPRTGRPTDVPVFDKAPREGRSASPEPRPGRRDDGFGGMTQRASGGLLGGGEARVPVRPVRELVPAKLSEVSRQEVVAQRFASDTALLSGQLQPRSLPGSERTQRLWAFFIAYAEAAAAQEPHPDTPEIFLTTLEEHGLGAWHDAASGQDALALARWILAAPTPEEARARAESVQLEPPPEVLLAESAPAPEHPEAPRPQAPRELRDSAFTESAERPAPERIGERGEFVRASPSQPGGVLHPPTPALSRDGRAEGDARVSGSRLSGTDKRLGPHLLWNVLHRFRASPEDSAQMQATWNRLAFGAVLALVGLALAGVALLSL